MTHPSEAFLNLEAGRFRTLTHGSGPETILFLHGLTGVAEVWTQTINALPVGRRYVALDQRGHGHSPHVLGQYTAAVMAKDVREAIQLLGPPVHLVGHSMGARIAILAASRFPQLLSSVSIVDIGPEASRANVESTTRGVASRPAQFASEEAAFAFAFRERTPSEQERAIFRARLQEDPSGTLTWRSPAEALIECVTRQRARNYWTDWRRIRIPAVFIHGGKSNEVSDRVAAVMRESNPRIRYERFEGVGHNIPLIAPVQLAESLERHWQSVTAVRASIAR